MHVHGKRRIGAEPGEPQPGLASQAFAAAFEHPRTECFIGGTFRSGIGSRGRISLSYAPYRMPPIVWLGVLISHPGETMPVAEAQRR